MEKKFFGKKKWGKINIIVIILVVSLSNVGFIKYEANNEDLEVSMSGLEAGETENTESSTVTQTIETDLKSSSTLYEENDTVQKEANITYSGHQQSYGDLVTVTNGETLGYVTNGKRLEALVINGEGVSISYNAHVQSYGWQGWKKSGELAGTKGEGKRLEAIKIKLTDGYENQFDIYYRMYITDIGWLDWAKNGELSGTSGYGCVAEGIEIQLLPKDSDELTDGTNIAYIDSSVLGTISYNGHVQKKGDMPSVSNGATLGTTGEALRMEAISVSLQNDNVIIGELTYQVHCQTYGWLDTKMEGEVAGTKGEAKRLEAINIKLLGGLAKYCDVYYRVHVQTYGWLGWAKNGENSGTQGLAKRIEAIEIRLVAKGGNSPFGFGAKFVDSNYVQAEIDGYVNAVYAQVINSSMTREEKLRACYDWVINNCSYKALFGEAPAGYTFEQWYALTMFRDHRGNCFAYASAFAMLARGLGYDATFYRGYITGAYGGWVPHGFVKIDGYYYDTQMQDSCGDRGFGPENQYNYREQ